MKLGTKFTLTLVATFVAGIAVSALFLSRALNRLAEEEVTSRGVALLQTMNSVRSYTVEHVRPHLAAELAASPEFISETVPAFSAREVFETLRGRPEYSNYLYKEAAINPTNPRDQADEFEADLLSQFKADRSLNELSGFRELNGQRLFYSARPLTISDESCLECHSDPSVAPASLIATYGSDGGFGWGMNDVIAAQMIYVPAGNVVDIARQSLLTVLAIIIGVFLLVVLLINTLLRRTVVSPVGELAALAEAISADQLTLDTLDAPELNQVTKRKDELGQLAEVFKRMARDVYQREQKLKAQLQELNIVIDEVATARQVDEITATDFFADLQKRAQEIRDRRKE
jgi:methyl-accepting chemotaxis protein